MVVGDLMAMGRERRGEIIPTVMGEQEDSGKVWVGWKDEKW